MVGTAQLSVEDFMAISGDGQRYELIDGVLQEMATASIASTVVGARAATALGMWVYPRGLGWLLDPRTRTASIWRPEDGGQELERLATDGILDGENALPGFRVRLSVLFALTAPIVLDELD